MTARLDHPHSGARTYRKPAAGQGCRVAGRSGKRIVIGFDDETFDEIRAIAVRRRLSFAEVARELVEFGLMDIEGMAS